MIIIRSKGRLGNQLFQYAFGYSLSRRERIPFLFLAPHKVDVPIFRYFRLRKFEVLIQLIKRIWFQRICNNRPSYYLLNQGGSEEIGVIIREAYSSRNVICAGYFQSLSYFHDYQKQIKDFFIPKSKYRAIFKKKYGGLFENRKVLVIHVRRTDYVDWELAELGEKNMTLPMIYYEKCLASIHRLEDYHVIVLSDDIPFTQKFFGDRVNFHFEHNTEIIDLQLMINADLLILSNSTFAWWGAFLNFKSPIVYAPKYFLGFKVEIDFPKGIYEGLDWNLVSVS